MSVPVATLGMKLWTLADEGSQPSGRMGVESSTGGGPPPTPALQTTGGAGELQGGKDPETTDACNPTLSSNLVARGGWPHRCDNAPPSNGERLA